jgi:TusA-related sulfurtransferase
MGIIRFNKSSRELRYLAYLLPNGKGGTQYSGGYSGRDSMIKADGQLDLCGVAAPYGLLTCKATLFSMKPGAVLEVYVRDPETVQDLLTVLERSEDKVLARVQNKDGMRLWVQKGSADAPCLIGPRNLKTN